MVSPFDVIIVRFISSNSFSFFLYVINMKLSLIVSSCFGVKQFKKSTTICLIFSSVKEYPRNIMGDSVNKVNIFAINNFLLLLKES